MKKPSLREVKRLNDHFEIQSLKFCSVSFCTALTLKPAFFLGGGSHTQLYTGLIPVYSLCAHGLLLTGPGDHRECWGLYPGLVVCKVLSHQTFSAFFHWCEKENLSNQNVSSSLPLQQALLDAECPFARQFSSSLQGRGGTPSRHEWQWQ